MSTIIDFNECFQYEYWAPQCLPVDAYLDAAFYKVPSGLYWRVLETNGQVVRAPASGQELLTIPFFQHCGETRKFIEHNGSNLLLSYIREFGSGVTWPSEVAHLETMLESYRNGPTRILIFSEAYEVWIRKKVDSRFLEGATFHLYDQTEDDCLDPTFVLVFSSLGKVISGLHGCGVALKEYEIRMCKLPVIPKTRYTRILESQQS